MTTRPTLELHAVTKSADGGKSFWTKIGAAWPHADGDGYSIRLEFLPLVGQSLVLRRPKPKTDASQADDRDDIPY